MKKQSIFAVLMAFSLLVGVQTFKTPVQANIGYKLNEHLGITGGGAAAVQGACTYAGAKGGAELGALIGTAFCPGLGTFIGGVLGAAAGAY